MFKYKLTLSYEGTRYGGWQIQKNHISIQAIVQDALSLLLSNPTFATGASRTDSGVHALGQVAHFSSEKECEGPNFIENLNALLPADIRALSCVHVEDTFHARYSARGKIYHYHLARHPSPFERRHTTHLIHKIDRALLEQACALFVGTHDFTTFANEAAYGSAARQPIKTLKRVTYVDEKGGFRIEFEGDGFLYKMIRNIVGTLLEAGSGKLALEEIPKLFAAKDRRKAPGTAPAQGLVLVEVLY